MPGHQDSTTTLWNDRSHDSTFTLVTPLTWRPCEVNLAGANFVTSEPGVCRCPVTYYNNKVNPSLSKPPLNFNGGLAKLGLKWNKPLAENALENVLDNIGWIIFLVWENMEAYIWCETRLCLSIIISARLLIQTSQSTAPYISDMVKTELW